MIRILLEIFIGLLLVIVAPLAVQAVSHSKIHFGRLLRLMAGIAIVIGYLVVWANTGLDPLQWAYCWFDPDAYSCQATDSVDSTPHPPGSDVPSVPIPPQSASRIDAQIQDALLLAGSVRVEIESYSASFGGDEFPHDNRAMHLPEPEQLIGNYTTSVTVEDGATHIALGNRADPAISGKIITLRPAQIRNSPTSPISWLCGYAEPAAGMVAKGENRTSVPSVFLPEDCRPQSAR